MLPACLGLYCGRAVLAANGSAEIYGDCGVSAAPFPPPPSPRCGTGRCLPPGRASGRWIPAGPRGAALEGSREQVGAGPTPPRAASAEGAGGQAAPGTRCSGVGACFGSQQRGRPRRAADTVTAALGGGCSYRCVPGGRRRMTTRSAGRAQSPQTATTGCTWASWPCCPWCCTGSSSSGIRGRRGEELFARGSPPGAWAGVCIWRRCLAARAAEPVATPRFVATWRSSRAARRDCFVLYEHGTFPTTSLFQTGIKTFGDRKRVKPFVLQPVGRDPFERASVRRGRACNRV